MPATANHVEQTYARITDLETQRREVHAALEAACRGGDAERMIALRHKLPTLDSL